MQSFKSRLLLSLLRNRHLLTGRLKPQTIDADFDIGAFRARIDRMTARARLAQGVSVEPADLDGLTAECLFPAVSTTDKGVLLYIHGGGFISGSCGTHRAHVSKIVAGSGVPALLFDYRLAPEHPFPAALEDCLTAYRSLLSSGRQPDEIVLGGESAGGTLVLSTLQAARAEGLPMPAAAFSISPVGDMRCQAPSFARNARRDIVPQGANDIWLPLYYGATAPTDPRISPLFGDFDGLPPLLILAGDAEIHLDDCRALADRAQAAGVETRLNIGPGMVHAYPMLAPLFREARDAMAAICDFTRHRLTDKNAAE